MKLQTASAMLLLAASGVASAQPSDIARDHDSILAMQGEYTVDFAFDETVLLKPGYERAPAMRSGGSEVVIVVEDTPKRIVLQHLLLDEKSGHITKHWRGTGCTRHRTVSSSVPTRHGRCAAFPQR